MTYFLNDSNVKQHCTCNIVLTTYTMLLYLLHYTALNCSNTGNLGFLFKYSNREPILFELLITRTISDITSYYRILYD